MNVKTLLIAVVFSISIINVFADDVKQAEDLLRRIAPEALGHIRFKKIKTKEDIFELKSDKDKVIIRGNNANSMAVGLNYYLKHYCLSYVSWFSTDSVQLPDVLPLVTPVQVSAKCKNRFFLNYCTFGYTMPWWGWNEWERFIDWMALNGINMPLAITGQEAIWFKVWQKMGLSEDEVRNYFTGPSHLPWHRMSNLDYWQGNLPDSWLENQLNLQKMILKRERELNMRPILPAFAGHVPKELAEKYPDAKISRMSSWGGFKDEYRSHFLDPMDPLFLDIQKSFISEQMNQFGTDHIYGADPFNEVDPPSWEPEFLEKVSKQIYGSMTAVDPKAQWLQMTWIFYHDSKNWTKPRLNAFINGLPKNKMFLLDYYCENTEIWKMTEKFYGQPYLWCYLGNFGGNTMLAGNFGEVSKRLDNVFINGGDNLTGVGATLEALDVNPFMYEFVFDKVWSTGKSDKEWIENLADRRAGSVDQHVRKAWKDLAEIVYTKPSRLGQGCMTNSRPQFKGRGKWVNPVINYSNEDLYNIWGNLLRFENRNRDSYKFDIVNVGRQFLGNHFNSLYNEFSGAYENKNIDSLVLVGAQMIELLNDLDLLLSTNPSFSLRKWISDARKIGRNTEEANYYEKNARTLLTTWGERNQSLNDYANRQWSGLVETYYKPRWEMFINDVILSVSQNKVFDQTEFNNKAMDFEWDWVNTVSDSINTKSSDPVITALHLYKKYGKPNDF